MTQYARPDADISDGDWLNQSDSNTNLYASIDESSASDSDYIYAEDEGYGSGSDIVCIIGLGDINEPDGNADHKIKYRATENSGMNAYSLKVELLEGSTVRKSVTNSSIGGSFATSTISLTTSEAGNISDYTNLRLRFTANDSQGGGYVLKVSWAEFQAPDAASGGGVATSPAFLLFVDF
jgi:hypothetical protein|tara:strand:+ start:19320 stop:19859 length:540 start_codon:yes stop_codon:yes gene_type:complete